MERLARRLRNKAMVDMVHGWATYRMLYVYSIDANLAGRPYCKIAAGYPTHIND